ncbi:MAG: hypothetical protein R3C28_04435 [Pirellulaceae bacterium]
MKNNDRIARELGASKRDAGIALAAINKQQGILRQQIEVLEAAIKSPDGTATIDDCTQDFLAEFSDGGRWRGAVVRGLALANIIESTGRVEKSRRASRHRAIIREWRLVDRQSAAALLSRLRLQLDAMEVHNVD